jgi:hypothetical protein
MLAEMAEASANDQITLLDVGFDSDSRSDPQSAIRGSVEAA